jgi:hypothetical protein
MKIKSIYKLNASILEILLSNIHKKSSVRLSLIKPISEKSMEDVTSLGINLINDDTSIKGDLEDGKLTYAECDEDCLVLIEESEEYKTLSGRIWKASDIIQKSTVLPHKIIIAANVIIVWRNNTVAVFKK